MFSLRTLIDDILLIVRNNNISESEDFSRAQIAAWVLHYKAALTKEDKDKKDQLGNDDDYDDTLVKVIGPLELEDVDSLDHTRLFVRKTVEEIDDLYELDPRCIVSVTDQHGEPIQYMNNVRRFFQWSRKYTNRDLTFYYKEKHIYVQGNADYGHLQYIWLKYIADESENEDASEDDIKIPEWMVPEIKNRIFKNELQLMLRMPSDDDNNATLDGIKPHGPQDQEK